MALPVRYPVHTGPGEPCAGRAHAMMGSRGEDQKCSLLIQKFMLPIKYIRSDIFSNPINTPRQTF